LRLRGGYSGLPAAFVDLRCASCDSSKARVA
jgi:hypothetical protein